MTTKTDEQIENEHAAQAETNAREARQRAPSSPRTLDESTPGWLKRLTENPPEFPSELELQRQARADRMRQAVEIRQRLPDRFQSWSAADFHANIHHDTLRKVATTWTPGQGSVLLLGETQLGKTTTIGYICRALLRIGVRDGGYAWDLIRGLYWIRADQLEQAARKAKGGEVVEMTKARECKLLAFDEIGWENHNYRKLIAQVLAERSEKDRLTLATSGKTIGELRSDDYYGDAVFVRLSTFKGRSAVVVEAFPERDQTEREEQEERRRAAAQTQGTHFSEAGGR